MRAAAAARLAQPLPLPIAVLVLEARNRIQREPTRAHLCAYFAWEASVRLSVAVEPPADAASLAMPSIGDLVRAIPPSAATFTRPELLAVVALLTGSETPPKSTTRARLLEFLPKYRNEHFHGGISGVAADGTAARVLLAGVDAAWQEGVFWPSSAALVFVEAVEIDSSGRRRAHVFGLEGLASQAEIPDDALHSVESEVLPGRVYLRSETRYRSLHPWLVYDDGRVLFFNGMKGKGGRYLDYAKNDHVTTKALAAKSPTLDDDLRGLFGGKGGPHRSAGNVAEAPSPVPTEPTTVRSPTARGPATRARSLALLTGAALLVAIGAWLAGTHARGRVATGGEPAASADSSASALAGARAGAADDGDLPKISSRADVQKEFRRGVEAYLAADIEAAERAFAVAANEEPKQPWPHLGRALTLGLERRYAETQRERSKATEAVLRDQVGDARDQELVRLLDKKGDGYVTGYAEYHSKYPHYVLGLQALAYYGTQNGPPDVRVHRFDDVLAAEPGHAITYLTKSQALLSLDQRDAAKAVLDEGLRRRASAPWLLDQRGVLLLAQGKNADAQQDFRAALANGRPGDAPLHYAVALLRSGAPGDAKLSDERAGELASIDDAEQRAQALCAYVMALSARGRLTDSEHLLDAALQARPGAGSALPGTVARCLVPPIWVDIALGRLSAADRKLDQLAAVFANPSIDEDDVRYVQLNVTALRGIVRAEGGRVTEAEAALRVLEDVPPSSSPVIYESLHSELDGRIKLAKHAPVEVQDPPSGASIATRARRAHLRGDVALGAKDLAGAEKAYASLQPLAEECENVQLAYELVCAGYVADGLSKLAILQRDQGRTADVRQIIVSFDTLWPRPDGDLEPAKVVRALQAKLPR